MNILILEDEITIVKKIKNTFCSLNNKDNEKIIIIINYLSTIYWNDYWKIKLCDMKLKLKWFNFIFIDRDNEYWPDFHTMFFNLLDKNIKRQEINNSNDIIDIIKNMYLISWSYINNIRFIELLINKLIYKYDIITNITEQKEIENILKNNIYSKSDKNYFEFMLNNLNKL